MKLKLSYKEKDKNKAIVLEKLLINFGRENKIKLKIDKLNKIYLGEEK